MQTQNPVQVIFVPPWLQKYISTSSKASTINTVGEYLEIVKTEEDIRYFDSANLWFQRCLCSDIIWTKLDDSPKPIVTTINFRSEGYDDKVDPYVAMTLDMDGGSKSTVEKESLIYSALKNSTVKLLGDGNIAVISNCYGESTTDKDLSGLRKEILVALSNLRDKSNVIETRLFSLYLKRDKPIPVRRV